MTKLLKKIEVWYSIRNNGDGSASPAWFLTGDDANRDQEEMSEGWGDVCSGSVETFVGSDIHVEAVENSKALNSQHEYLKSEDYYENRPVGTGARSSKTCEHCGKTISKGTPHDVHKFYPEFNSYPTHKKCTKDFIASLKP